MKNISFVLTFSGVCVLNTLSAQTIASTAKASPDYDVAHQSSTKNHNEFSPSNRNYSLDRGKPAKNVNHSSIKSDKKQKAREAILPLLRGVFNTHRDNLEVTLTIDAGWRDDSLSIEYKYYAGNNTLTLDDNLLVEKSYYTVKPEEIDVIDTEQDEFQFLYLRNKKKVLNVHHLVNLKSKGVTEEKWCSSFGIPVRSENLPLIIQLLKDLRAAD
jgi:hypothetical protein